MTSDQQPSSGSSQLTLARFLPYRLNVAATAVSEGLAGLYGDRFGIGVAEWRIVATLGEFSRMTAKQVAAHTRMGKVKVSRTVAALESRGLLDRKSNSEDRREEFLSLSPAGAQVYDDIVPLALGYSEMLARHLSAEDYATLDRILDKLIDFERPDPTG
jgi:DNA-binding MarR family transcriptional regulator